MRFPKFIIEGEKLILGTVQYHKHLSLESKPSEIFGMARINDLCSAPDYSKIKGGGWYHQNNVEKSITFDGTTKSEDFGSAPMSLVLKCVSESKVFSKSGVNISGKFTFFYSTGSEIMEI